LTIDYYLVPDGVLIEEFVRERDYSARGLCGAIWTAGEPRWRGASSFSRAVRTDPGLLARVVPTDRAGAQAVIADLAAEGELRAHFVDYEPFNTAPPLRLRPEEESRRLYRVLFAKDLSGADFAGGSRTVGHDHFSWALRRVGGGLGWGLDVTVLLATDADDTVGPVVDELTGALRGRGLIPVTTERFA
jgi:hypothetical protein